MREIIMFTTVKFTIPPGPVQRAPSISWSATTKQRRFRNQSTVFNLSSYQLHPLILLILIPDLFKSIQYQTWYLQYSKQEQLTGAKTIYSPVSSCRPKSGPTTTTISPRVIPVSSPSWRHTYSRQFLTPTMHPYCIWSLIFYIRYM